jgi:hypothetical protein
MTTKSPKSPKSPAAKVVKPARKGTVRTSAGKAAPVTVRKVAPTKAPRKATAKATAKKVPAKPVPTPDAPLASGWVRQSTVRPDADTAPSRFTTQTQRRLLRETVADGALPVADLPTATQRTVARLTELGLVTVAKGTAKATKAGREFVSANPAPKVRAPKAKATGKAPAKAAKKAPAAKAAPKSAPAKATTGRKVVRKSAKAAK